MDAEGHSRNQDAWLRTTTCGLDLLPLAVETDTSLWIAQIAIYMSFGNIRRLEMCAVTDARDGACHRLLQYMLGWRLPLKVLSTEITSCLGPLAPSVHWHDVGDSISPKQNACLF